MWLFIGLPILTIFIMLVVHASGNLNKIKSNWSEYRCNPIYIPFAGIVDPDTGIEKNLVFCMNQLANEVMKFVIDDIHLLFKTVYATLSEITGPLNIFRTMLSMLRKFVLSFTSSTLGKATNSVSVFVSYLAKIRDVLKRFVGSGYIATFLAYTGISFVESFVTLCISVIKGFVYAMLAISIVLALFQPELLAITIALASLLAAAGA